jgi:hypothetical protein
MGSTRVKSGGVQRCKLICNITLVNLCLVHCEFGNQRRGMCRCFGFRRWTYWHDSEAASCSDFVLSRLQDGKFLENCFLLLLFRSTRSWSLSTRNWAPKEPRFRTMHSLWNKRFLTHAALLLSSIPWRKMRKTWISVCTQKFLNI